MVVCVSSTILDSTLTLRRFEMKDFKEMEIVKGGIGLDELGKRYENRF